MKKKKEQYNPKEHVMLPQKDHIGADRASLTVEVYKGRTQWKNREQHSPKHRMVYDINERMLKRFAMKLQKYDISGSAFFLRAIIHYFLQNDENAIALAQKIKHQFCKHREGPAETIVGELNKEREEEEKTKKAFSLTDEEKESLYDFLENDLPKDF